MKRRQLEPEIDSDRAERSLCEALLSLRSVDEVRAFLEDLCTPAELEAMADRWRVVPLLLEGVPYREIHERPRSASPPSAASPARSSAAPAAMPRLPSA